MMAGPSDLRAILAFYVEAGVDALVQEEPVDRFADVERPAPLLATASAAPANPPPAKPPQASALAGMSAAKLSRPGPVQARAATDVPPTAEAAVMAARELARSATSLEELRTLL